MVRLTALVLLVAASLAVAACGDDDDAGEAGSETTVVSPGVSGELTAEGIGELRRGDTTEKARALFGEPVEKNKSLNCELAPGGPRVVGWVYELGRGIVVLTFDAPRGQLRRYRVTTPSLETSRGDKIGELFAELRSNWGGSLKGFALGVKPTAKQGFWQVRGEGDSWLLFDVRGGKVADISGGKMEVCE